MKNRVTYSAPKTFLLWALQIIVSLLLVRAVYTKLLATPGMNELFDVLGMGAGGRIFVGVLELLIILLLLSWRFSASGAILGMAVMLGAIIAHITVLGITSSLMAILIFILCTTIFVLRRKEAPLIGEQM